VAKPVDNKQKLILYQNEDGSNCKLILYSSMEEAHDPYHI
jgi:hypothetical protein